MALNFDAKANFAYSVVATAPSPAASGTSLVVAAGDGTKFPSPPFNAVIWPTAVQPTTANAEIVRVTNIVGDTLTITRTQESTAARTVIINDQIALNITAKTLTDIQAGFTTASVLAMPIGGGCLWFTDTAPTGFIFARGQAISRATYATLFALFGTTYGVGDGSTTFNVPNLQVRIPIGRDSTGVVTAVDTLGETQGSWDHTHGPGTLTVASHTHGFGTLQVESHAHGPGTLTVASHTHGAGTLTVASHSHGAGSLAADSGGSHTHTGTTANAGDHSHAVTASGNELSGDQDGFSFVEDGSTSTDGDHSHTFTTDSGGSHTHSISGSTGNSAPAVDAGVTGSSAPSVTGGSSAASAPFVAGGATGATAPAVSAGVTAAGNPPVLVVNYIIRATNEA